METGKAKTYDRTGWYLNNEFVFDEETALDKLAEIFVQKAKEGKVAVTLEPMDYSGLSFEDALAWAAVKNVETYSSSIENKRDVVAFGERFIYAKAGWTDSYAWVCVTGRFASGFQSDSDTPTLEQTRSIGRYFAFEEVVKFLRQQGSPKYWVTAQQLTDTLLKCEGDCTTDEGDDISYFERDPVAKLYEEKMWEYIIDKGITDFEVESCYDSSVKKRWVYGPVREALAQAAKEEETRKAGAGKA